MHGAAQLIEGHPLLLGHRQVHGQDDGAGRIDGHGGGHLVQGDALEESLHVPQGVDAHPDLAHFALGQGVVGIIADLGGEVEGHGQPGLAGFQEEMVALVGLLGGGETGILAHGPEAAAVGGGLHRPGVGILARHTQLLQVVELLPYPGEYKPD